MQSFALAPATAGVVRRGELSPWKGQVAGVMNLSLSKTPCNGGLILTHQAEPLVI